MNIRTNDVVKIDLVDQFIETEQSITTSVRGIMTYEDKVYYYLNCSGFTFVTIYEEIVCMSDQITLHLHEEQFFIAGIFSVFGKVGRMDFSVNVTLL